jgi:hypothetical protein
MNILARNELIALFKSNALGIEDQGGIINTWADRDYSRDNPFQQCSIDIHVGYILEFSNFGGTIFALKS